VTPRAIAFHHPRPGWPLHLLIVPRVGIADAMSIRQSKLPYLAAMFNAATRLSAGHDPGEHPIALVINAGIHQDVGQLHAHLIAGPDVPRYTCPPGSDLGHTFATGQFVVRAHSSPSRETHLVLRRLADRTGEEKFAPMDAALAGDLGTIVERLLTAAEPPLTGWSLIAGMVAGTLDLSCLHLVSGPPPRPEPLAPVSWPG
ncbi:MAG: HIT domain-containing protein, partial [Chloroflexota bacterium]|nr:HIT domain-containing protein [Chloroflexota bacterium]